MEKVKFRYTHDNAVARIMLDDGKGNVIDHVMMANLMELFNTLAGNKGLKMIVLEGAGKHFSFGASVEEHQKEYAAVMIREFHMLFYKLMELSVPMMAKVSGQCLGGGFEMALMCNFIFADKSAKMSQPEISLGVFPPPASVLLPEKIGLARAEELLITGKTITAEEAKAMGLVNELFDDKQALEIGIENWIEKHILPKSASSLRLGVKAARIKFNHVLSNFLPQLEGMYIKDLMSTYDANEGISSFLEKRQPEWQNN